MSRRIATVTRVSVVLVATFVGVRSSSAAAVNIDGVGSPYTRANFDALFADGDNLTVTGNSVINMDDATDSKRIQFLTVNPGISLTVNFTGGGTLTFSNAAGDGNAFITVNATGTMTITGATGGINFAGNGAGGAKMLAIQGTIGGTGAGNKVIVGDNLLLMAAASLNIVEIGGASAVVDINENTTITTLTTTGNATIQVAAGKTLTSTVDVNANTVMLTETGTISTVNMDTANGVLDVNESCTITNVNLTANATIQVAATKTLTSTVDVNANTVMITETGTITAVNMDTANGVLDVNESCTVSNVNMTANGTILVAVGKVLTSTVDVNANNLTLSEAGTVSTVVLDTAGGNILAKAGGTITTLTHTASTLTLSNGVAFTVTNPINVGAATFVVAGSGGGVQDTLNATFNLNNATSKLQITGATADNIKGMTINATIAGATLDVDASVSPTAVNVSANATIDVAAGQTLTGPVTMTDKTLTLLGGGTLTQVTATAGIINADGSTTITTLTANPGAGATFTYGGTGSSTVTTLTPLDANGETFVKMGTGSLSVTNGFSFSGGTGILLNVNAGTFTDPTTSTLSFGDDAEEIVVASGATYTTSRSITGDSGTNANLDGAATSIVNFAKSGTVTLTSTANNDFRLLGTVNVQNGCTVDLAGAFASEFGNVNVKTSGTLSNTTPSSTMLFAPGSTVTLEGTGSGTLTIDGQATGTRVTVGTIGATESFTIDRGGSTNMTFKNVALSNCSYSSADGGSADAELQLVGVKDAGNNMNWFSALIAEAGADKTIISGNTTTLDGSAGGASGTYRFFWTPAIGLSDATVAQPTASPTETTMYTLIVLDDVDPSRMATDTARVTVTPPLAANAGADKEVPAGDSVMLDGSASGGAGRYAFAWTPTDGLDDATLATPVATPTATTTYTLTVTDLGDDNKTASDDVLVTVIVTPLGVCGNGVCGAGAISLMPIMLLGPIGWKRALRRKRSRA